MKIGIITFHWATNYGAVLQTYALQTYISSLGHDVEIINYVPFRNKVSTVIKKLFKLDLDYFKNEHKISIFRKKYLHLSKHYFFQKSLNKVKDKYDCVIAGSDQIWNTSFTLQQGRKPNLVYFLSFVGKNTKKISYAASFGSIDVPINYIKIVKQELKDFKHISVREASGVKIIEDIGFRAQLVCDPTLLVDLKCYEKLVSNNKTQQKKIFSFILHNDIIGSEIVSSIVRLTDYECYSEKIFGVSEWLSCIKNSSLVVTNSFHCIVFSILFNKPFVALGIKGSGMNDRLLTLLKYYNLDGRIVFDNETEIIEKILNNAIDWAFVNEVTKKIQNQGKLFLEDALHE